MKNQKNVKWRTYLILCFLLGGIGAHHFYAGKTIPGILSILFCWTMIPGLIALIQFIRVLVMPLEDFHKRFNP